jgi:hypothetical protein
MEHHAFISSGGLIPLSLDSELAISPDGHPRWSSSKIKIERAEDQLSSVGVLGKWPRLPGSLAGGNFGQWYE